MKLREQIYDISKRRFNEAFAGSTSFPTQVNELTAYAFGEEWEPGRDTRAVRRAWVLLNGRPGFVLEDEPGVE
jgi:hypothetical protein